MRATVRLCMLLGAVLALPVSIAQAKITPLPRPAGISAKPAGGERGSLIAPVSRPAAGTTVRPATHPLASTRTPSVGRAAGVQRPHGFAPASIEGGREQGWLVPSFGGRDGSALAAATAIVPTPLDLVGVGESLPAYDNALPSWKIVLLTLLAFAEAFVLVRLVRARLAPAGDI